MWLEDGAIFKKVTRASFSGEVALRLAGGRSELEHKELECQT